MPVGEPLGEALSQSTLREVVAAVGGIADTLGRLHERFQIHHRDIKPSNLYLIDGRPAIADFGLVDLPDSDDITITGRPLGPKYFQAYEMVIDPVNADPAPADVFSLAKTLWVLCVDQRWPPQGEQHASNEAYSIGRYRPHPLAHHLDNLIERCTRHEASERPTMSQVSEDLHAWLSLDVGTPHKAVDLSAVWRRLRATAEPRLREVHDEAARRTCFRSAVRRFQELIDPINAEIRQQFPAAEFDCRGGFVDALFRTHSRHETTNEDIRATILAGPGWNPVKLIIGVAIRTRSGLDLEIEGAFYLGRIETMGGHLNDWRSDRKVLRCDSAALEVGLAQVAEEMQDTFPEWLEQFTIALESSEA